MAKKLPSYRLHRTSGQAVVTLSGRDHYLGRHGTPESRAEYDRVIAEWLAAGRVPRPPAGRAGATVAEALLAYGGHAATYYVKDGAPTSQLARVRKALSVVRHLYGDAQAASFDQAALKACRTHMAGLGWCRKVVNQHVGCVVLCFRWLAEEKLVPASVWHDLACVSRLKRGRGSPHDHPPVPPAPEDAVGPALGKLSAVLADVARLQLLTAARPGEALSLKACEIDTSGDVWLWRPARHKNQHHDRERVLFVGPQAQALLAPYLARRGDGFLFSPRDAVAQRHARERAARKTKVQPSQVSRTKARPKRTAGERYAETSYARAVARACEAAGVAHWSPNQLRHNAATRLVAQFGWEICRLVLGHSSVSMTRVYALDDTARAAEAMKKYG